MGSLSPRAIALFLSTAVLPLAAQVVTTFYQGREVVANEVIVRLRGSDQQTLSRLAGRIPDARITPIGGSLGLHVIRSNTYAVSRLLSIFGADAEIVHAGPNHILRTAAIPSDPLYSQLWGMQKIGAEQAWDIGVGSTSVAVAVIDTGVDYTHPDLAANIWSAPASFTVNLGGQNITCPAGSHGFNAIAMSCDPKDDNAHGTHVSGTIGAAANNSIGVAGINWSTRIVGVKFLDSSGSGTLADAINAIEFAIQVNAAFTYSPTPLNLRVLSASWGSADFDPSLLDELNRANDNQLLFVAAAGNQGDNNDTAPFYPANYLAPNVISVAATDSSDALASFSNHGSNSVHLGAPGVGILSTVAGGGYASWSGTSMATPHVSGAAALILAACPALTTAQLKAALLNTVDPVSSLVGNSVTGGRLNVAKAVQSCNSVSSSPGGCMVSTVPADHWKGEYFTNMTLSGSPSMVRDDGAAVLNFNWGIEGSPSPACNFPGVLFSVRWTRTVNFNTGTYRFSTSADDGMRLYIDGQKVLDRWSTQSPATAQTVDVPLGGGVHTVIVEYYQARGPDSGAVSWQQLIAPMLTNSFGAPAIPVGGTTSLTLTLTNPSSTALFNVGATDGLPSGLLIATPSGFASNCAYGGMTAAAGSHLIGFSGVTLPGNVACTFKVNVMGIGAGLQTNTTTAITSANGGTGLPATAAIMVLPPDAATAFQVRYAANLDVGDAAVDFTNTGSVNGLDPDGRMCINVYSFDPYEEMVSCCACEVTPNGLNRLSARNDLLANTLTPAKPASLVIKLLANYPVDASGKRVACNASLPTAANLAPGLRAWGTSLHALPTVPVSFGSAETPFSPAELSASELAKLTSYCAFFQATGSGFGICKSCQAGASGANQR